MLPSPVSAIFKFTPAALIEQTPEKRGSKRPISWVETMIFGVYISRLQFPPLVEVTGFLQKQVEIFKDFVGKRSPANTNLGQ
jgi:hypothetical protein